MVSVERRGIGGEGNGGEGEKGWGWRRERNDERENRLAMNGT